MVEITINKLSYGSFGPTVLVSIESPENRRALNAFISYDTCGYYYYCYNPRKMFIYYEICWKQM